MIAERLEDRTLLVVTIDLYPINLSVPAHCANHDPQFEFVMPAQLDPQTGAPIPEDVLFRYSANGMTYESIESPLYFAYTEELPPVEPMPYWVYRHRFLDVNPPPDPGTYLLEVFRPITAPLREKEWTFTFGGDTNDAPAGAVTGLAITGPLMTPISTEDGPVALLNNEGDLTEVTISWDADPDADYFLYELAWLRPEPSETPFRDTYETWSGLVATTSTSVTFTGLKFGTYVFRVRAVNCNGEGDGWSTLSFVVSDPLFISLFDNHEEQCQACGVTTTPAVQPAPDTDAEHGNGDVRTPVAEPAPNSMLKDAQVPHFSSGSNPHPVTTTSFRLPYKSIEVSLDATAASGPAADEPAITVITGQAITSKNKPQRVLVPGQLSTASGASGLKDTNIKLKFRLPLPVWDGILMPDFIGSIKPTDKVPVLDRSKSPFGRRVGLPIDDFLDTSLVDNDPNTEGAPALIRGNGTIVEYTGKGNATWNAPHGSFTSITRPGGSGDYGDYVVTNQMGDKWIFDGSASLSRGVLKEIQAWTGEVTKLNRSASDLNGDGVLNDLLTIEYFGAAPMSMLMDAVSYTWTGTNITAVTDLDGRVWTYEYGANNLLLSVTGPPNAVVPGLTNVERSKTVLSYVAGDPTYTLERIERRDETGTFSEKTSFVFDQWRNVTSITQESTTLGNRTWGFSSAESKRLNGQYLWVQPEVPVNFPEITWTTGPEDTITLPNGDIIRRQVDPFGNTLQERHTFSSATGSKEVVTLYERNVHGQVRRQTGPSLTGQSAPILVTNFTYDGSRRLTNIAYPDSTTEVWTYNAPGLSGPHQPDTFTNRVGHKTTYGYTAGQRTSETVRNAADAFMWEQHTMWSGMMVKSITLPSSNGGAQGDSTRPAVQFV